MLAEESYHLAKKSERVGDKLGFVFDVQLDYVHSEINQQLDTLCHFIEFEELRLQLEIEEDLTDDDFEGEVQYLIAELLVIEFELFLQDLPQKVA